MDDSHDSERTYKMGDFTEHGLGEPDCGCFGAVVRGDVLGDSHYCTSAESPSDAVPEETFFGRECSMCGDVGIYEDLFQCKRCLRRYQHIYCSRSYPNLGSEKWICNWCLHAEDNSEAEKQQKMKRKAITTSETSRNNAFEFLLQIAQSLPEAGSDADDAQRNNSSSSRETDVTNGQVPRRQRYSHIQEKSRVIASNRWSHIAKSRLQLNPPRGIARRYKLLADVLC